MRRVTDGDQVLVTARIEEATATGAVSLHTYRRTHHTSSNPGWRIETQGGETGHRGAAPGMAVSRQARSSSVKMDMHVDMKLHIFVREIERHGR